MTAEIVSDGRANALARDAETMPRSRREELDAVEVSNLPMLGLALLAGPANVIMQLSLPAVGYGVYESTVESGNLFKHPVKRTRTTLTYLAVAAMGSPDIRKAYRHAVNKSHAYVRSNADSPVKYNAFDPALQLWVAACLYRGWEDVQRIFGDPASITEEAYQQGAVMGTTLQMPREMWPATRADFEEYWQQQVAGLQIDDTIRGYLLGIMEMRFSLGPVRMLTRWFSETMTIGFLPPEFREKMRVDHTPAQRRFFRAHAAVARRLIPVLPKPLREFPFNLLLADLEWRRRTDRPLV
ncbi:oxygenase MpaB family protein [Gordonia sp. PP30]|uniref:oxygenase MpaB family protein n=1 Tax=unclassified Gordonia (in: high G+C Gram-positive bacteria) TaxID=2657482 RepID=UPI001FFEBDA4|nr:MULTISPECIES: oxygenase MpaB family protein [unclassified Gordonia (in: high G+C Gram-positive bacteria)]UQE74955.1 oxygenase MpaB family protein [Gordonia sp. PP30]